MPASHRLAPVQRCAYTVQGSTAGAASVARHPAARRRTLRCAVRSLAAEAAAVRRRMCGLGHGQEQRRCQLAAAAAQERCERPGIGSING